MKKTTPEPKTKKTTPKPKTKKTTRKPKIKKTTERTRTPAAKSAAHARITPQYPCLCPGESYPITRAVCLGRQERNYDKCLKCEHAIRARRPRQSDFEGE